MKDSGAEGGVENYVAVPADGYPVTGILIGGQKQVTWDFTPVEDADEFTIYDANVEGAAVVGTASEPMYKLLKSAIANAENNHGMDRENLYVSTAVANPGPTLKRGMPRAQGRFNRILKRTTHITIGVSEKA